LFLALYAAYSEIMSEHNRPIKDAILLAALPNIPFDGWRMDVLQQAAEDAGYTPAMVISVFPVGVKDAIRHFSVMADSWMMEKLAATNPVSMRVRDRVAMAVRARLEGLEPYKEAEKLAIAYWMRPFRKWEGAKLVWKTADIIWHWAGDTATDYNRYTKRGLLSGVLTSTVLFWLNDTSDDHQDSWDFLDRRIENVMTIGKIAGKFKTA
jgi:ubiquinone biosynthesis protein COQ9